MCGAFTLTLEDRNEQNALSLSYLWFGLYFPSSLASRRRSVCWECSPSYYHINILKSLAFKINKPIYCTSSDSHRLVPLFLTNCIWRTTLPCPPPTHSLKLNGFCFYPLLLLQRSSSVQRSRQDSYLPCPLTFDMISTS